MQISWVRSDNVNTLSGHTTHNDSTFWILLWIPAMLVSNYYLSEIHFIITTLQPRLFGPLWSQADPGIPDK